ncbi:MAG: HAMP domain-containing histidine kinase [Crocinitomicaceae bacterium]|nr:HAMP domain-containing histidine kinase [Crocinitomicaceae bacterium]
MDKLLKSPVWIFYILVAYIMVQFSWWLYLIYDLNTQLYAADIVGSKLMMVVGEGMVFLSVLILGIILIRRGLNREKKILKIQENFLMSVTHELKTPIASAKLNLQTLSRPNLPQEKNQEVMNSALTSVNRLDKLVNNLLLAKSISNQNYFSDKEEINLANMMQELIKFQFSKTKERISFNGDVQLALITDRQALQSIVVNLIDNALKYTTGHVEVSIEGDNSEIKISVKDEGDGIPEDSLKDVTRKFFRMESEMTRSHKGTGLGLYIVAEMAETIGAEFILKNRKDKNGLIANIVFKNGK